MRANIGRLSLGMYATCVLTANVARMLCNLFPSCRSLQRQTTEDAMTSLYWKQSTSEHTSGLVRLYMESVRKGISTYPTLCTLIAALYVYVCVIHMFAPAHPQCQAVI